MVSPSAGADDGGLADGAPPRQRGGGRPGRRRDPARRARGRDPVARGAGRRPRRPSSTPCATPCARRRCAGSSAATTRSTRYSDPDINTQARADALSKYATQGNQDAIDAFEAAAEDLQVAQDELAAKREDQKDAIAELEERRAALEREFERLEALEKERQEAERRRREAAARAAAAASSSRIPPQRPRRQERPERPGGQRAGRRDHLPGAGPRRLQRHLGRIAGPGAVPTRAWTCSPRWARPPSRR